MPGLIGSLASAVAIEGLKKAGRKYSEGQVVKRAIRNTEQKLGTQFSALRVALET